MSDASAITRVPLTAKDHSQWSLPAAAPAWSRPEGGTRAETPRSFLQTHFQMRGSIPAELRSQFPALISSLPPLILPPPWKPEQRAGRHQRLRILLPAANKTYLSLPRHSPCPLSGGTEQKDPLP